MQRTTTASAARTTLPLSQRKATHVPAARGHPCATPGAGCGTAPDSSQHPTQSRATASPVAGAAVSPRSCASLEFGVASLCRATGVVYRCVFACPKRGLSQKGSDPFWDTGRHTPLLGQDRSGDTEKSRRRGNATPKRKMTPQFSGAPQMTKPDLARIEAADAAIHALMPEPDRATRIDRECSAAPDGPLHGLVVGVKDVFHVDGLPTTAGSTLPPEELAGPEAAAVSLLRAAGAIVLGKTVSTEFAYAEPGPTRNPHNV